MLGAGRAVPGGRWKLCVLQGGLCFWFTSQRAAERAVQTEALENGSREGLRSFASSVSGLYISVVVY